MQGLTNKYFIYPQDINKIDSSELIEGYTTTSDTNSGPVTFDMGSHTDNIIYNSPYSHVYRFIY